MENKHDSVKNNNGLQSIRIDSKQTQNNPLLHLQHTIGNQAVQKLMRSNTGFDFGKIGIQPKLKVSQPGDMYEQEADKVAEQIMGMSNTLEPYLIKKSSIDKKVRRKCKGCKEEEEEKLKVSRKKNNSNCFEVSDIPLEDIDQTLSQEGSPPDTSTREFMESKFGYDFSEVRIHNNEWAARSTESLNALAYTVGNDIVFGEGQYRPSTLEGRRLLAHELTHVVQQKGTLVQGKIPSSLPANVYLQEKDNAIEPTLCTVKKPSSWPSNLHSTSLQRKCNLGSSSWVTKDCSTQEEYDHKIFPFSDARCPYDETCEDDPLADYQGHGTTHCDTSTGNMVTNVTEHCGGDCVAQHEAIHRRDRAGCCTKVKECQDRAPDVAGRNACVASFNGWFPLLSDWTECNAYTHEVGCLTNFIANNCDGARQAAIGATVGGVIGGVLGGIGGFLVGGPLGAVLGGVGGAATGAGIGYLTGRVSPDCCRTLRTELAFANGERARRCAAATNVPCPL